MSTVHDRIVQKIYVIKATISLIKVNRTNRFTVTAAAEHNVITSQATFIQNKILLKLHSSLNLKHSSFCEYPFLLFVGSMCLKK